MRRTVVGVLAHVDAGKTTLSEAMLYTAGAIRRLGRVDHADAFLDMFALERARGITIFSKQAQLLLPELQLTLLDTPGHADFSAEMERTLSVLDAAILVVSGTAGIQPHTMTVWRLLRVRQIPTFLFVNKTDLPGVDRSALLDTLRRDLSDAVCDPEREDAESIALRDETLLNAYLESGELSDACIAESIRRCRLFPCAFGSALRLEGVEEFLHLLERFVPTAPDFEEFGARVFKITRDETGARLTHLRVTGGVLRVRDSLRFADREEKITALRVYQGAKYRPVEEAYPGDVVTALGLTRSFPGQGLGAECEGEAPTMTPPLLCRVRLPEGTDRHKALAQLRLLEEEEPTLRVDWDEHLQELRVALMGDIQREILHELLLERFALDAEIEEGSILYLETIAESVEGVGHYEPLRHYAEVHLLLEPGERGSGLHFATNCREDELDRNWQRLILTHLTEKEHRGVLTGSPITDMTITLLAGRAHLKHTEGGDFRQATYRAVRQGLMRAKSVLLEPWYEFRFDLPQSCLGRALSDLERMGAQYDPPETLGELAVLRGRAPVAKLRSYPAEITAFTHGLGRVSLLLAGYEPCAEAESVIASIGYEAERDTENPADSVFCSHGAGVNVPWNEVERHMHLPAAFTPEREVPEEAPAKPRTPYSSIVASDRELQRIFERTYGAVKRPQPGAAMRPSVKKPAESRSSPGKAAPPPAGPEYTLVDGYNIICASEELRALAAKSMDAARRQLTEQLRNLQAYQREPLILVFDAYRVRGNVGSIERDGDFSVVFTREAETADMYIERVTRQLGGKHRVRVATSDALEQIIIFSHGALRIPARLFLQEIAETEREIRRLIGEQRKIL